MQGGRWVKQELAVVHTDETLTLQPQSTSKRDARKYRMRMRRGRVN